MWLYRLLETSIFFDLFINAPINVYNINRELKWFIIFTMFCLLKYYINHLEGGRAWQCALFYSVSWCRIHRIITMKLRVYLVICANFLVVVVTSVGCPFDLQYSYWVRINLRPISPIYVEHFVCTFFLSLSGTIYFILFLWKFRFINNSAVEFAKTYVEMIVNTINSH